MRTPTAEALIQRLKLQPHPEGGYFRQTWVAEAKDEGYGKRHGTGNKHQRQ